jgi:pSer/pThr/pTyr-binding forkhead associated (FHA) protein
LQHTARRTFETADIKTPDTRIQTLTSGRCFLAHLIVMFKDQTMREVHIGKEPLKIGRDSSNHIRIDNPSVSRFHAVIYRQGHPFFIEDKNSTNGVQVNGITITWKSGLQDGDVITIGKHTLLFKTDPGDYDDGKKISISDIEGTVKIGKN